MKSARAVAAGVLLVVVVTTIVDVILHAAGFFPPLGERIDDAQAVVGTSYRIVIGAVGGWLTARLAPARPMKHAIVLGCVGAAFGLAGLLATWSKDLGPKWYGVAHVVLAIPETWIGGMIFVKRAAPR